MKPSSQTTLTSIITARRERSVSRTVVRPGGQKLTQQTPYKVIRLT